MSTSSTHCDLLKATTAFHTSQYISRNYRNCQNVAAGKMVRERQRGKERRGLGRKKERRRKLIVCLSNTAKERSHLINLIYIFISFIFQWWLEGKDWIFTHRYMVLYPHTVMEFIISWNQKLWYFLSLFLFSLSFL